MTREGLRRRFRQLHLIAQALELPDVAAFDLLGVQMRKVVCSQILVRAVVAQHMVDADEETVHDGEDRAVLAAASARRWNCACR